eukprot:scaffold23358_cov34-Prasinocladus_malaysianus.AAC.1
MATISRSLVSHIDKTVSAMYEAAADAHIMYTKATIGGNAMPCGLSADSNKARKVHLDPAVFACGEYEVDGGLGAGADAQNRLFVPGEVMKQAAADVPDLR